MTGQSYQGQGVFEKLFKVDGGKTVMLPMTTVGALPAENISYKWDVAGINLEVPRGHASRPRLGWVFTIQVRHAEAIEDITIEQVSESGDLIALVRDGAVTLKQGYWRGRAAQQEMSDTFTPWLFQTGDSHFLFKVRIRVPGREDTVMYQPSLISKHVKSVYLGVMQGM